MKAVDAHCHLDFENFDPDREDVIQRCSEKLDFIVNAGASVEHNRATMELAADHPDFIVPTLGLHPTYTDKFDQLNEVKSQVREEDPTAVGEIGLDYHHVREREKREIQEEVFREMLSLAEELGKPVVVHSRDAEKKAVEILSSYDIPEVMLHCFNGRPELASEVVERGMHVGITTQVLYLNRVQDITAEIPLDRMLLETDSPFLYNDERNEPLNVLESVQKISDIIPASPGRIAEETTSNAERIFR